MKSSRYNFFFEGADGSILAYNALRNGLAVVDADIRAAVESLEPGGEPRVDSEMLAELERGGFVIPDDLDELAVLRIRRHVQQYGGNWLGLTIAPTINCNLACKYCFENPTKGIMSEEVQDKVVELASQGIEAGMRGVSLTWYGGEPLLCMDVIERLSSKLIVLCEDKKVGYTASIITNGTLLSREVAEKLKALKVTSAQVTLDGPREVHDRRRPYRSGAGTFDTIISRLEEAAGILPVALRVNVDRSNVEKARRFYGNLSAYSWFDPEIFSVYFGYVRKFSASCRCSQDECLMLSEFWDREYELQEQLVGLGVTEPAYPDISSGCGATSISSYVVGPEGELYKCWNHLGDRTQVVGNVAEPVDFGPLYIRYLSESFENDPECLECRFLPICMGGCVDVRIQTKLGRMPEKDCARWKFYLGRQLKLYYTYKLNERSEDKAETEQVVAEGA